MRHHHLRFAWCMLVGKSRRLSWLETRKRMDTLAAIMRLSRALYLCYLLVAYGVYPRRASVRSPRTSEAAEKRYELLAVPPCDGKYLYLSLIHI